MRSAKYSKFAAAAVVYTSFAVYLYLPYFKNFDRIQYLLVVNVCLASLGCYVLSCRWVVGFTESFFAGAIYGFGPFTLGLVKFHPTAGFLVATIPWLFCPVAFSRKARWRWLQVPLSAMPFLAILLFFQVAAHYRLFPVPTQAKLHLADLGGLLAPLVMAKRGTTLVGFYHIPIAAIIMGFSMLVAARRIGVMIILALAVVLACCNSLFGVSPIIWLAIGVLCCSVLAGAGMQGLICSGFADRRWVLAVAVIMGTFAIVTLLLATKYFQVFAGLGSEYAKLFTETAKMYILGTVAVAMLFFVVRAKSRIAPLRWIILCSTMTLDIFLGARFIIDTNL
jgi:hypothetical protein